MALSFCRHRPALLLVHGLLGHSFSWRNSIPALARRASVYAVDLPGSGYSAAPIHGDDSLPATAQRLLRFLDAMNISQCDILGSSYGGAVALMAAGLAPQRFRSLLLAAPVNPWSAHGKLFAPLVSNPLVAPVLLRALPHLTMLHEFYFRRLFGDTRRIPPGTLAGSLLSSAARNFAPHYARSAIVEPRSRRASRYPAPNHSHSHVAAMGKRRCRGRSCLWARTQKALQPLPTSNVRGNWSFALRGSAGGICRAIAEFLQRTM